MKYRVICTSNNAYVEGFEHLDDAKDKARELCEETKAPVYVEAYETVVTFNLVAYEV